MAIGVEDIRIAEIAISLLLASAILTMTRKGGFLGMETAPPRSRQIAS